MARRDLLVSTGAAALIFGAVTALAWPSRVADGAPRGPLHGVALGMTAEQIGARFDAAGGGTWERRRQGKIDVLTWRSRVDAPGARELRFDLHDGLLVAIRARVPPADELAQGLRLTVTPLSLTARLPRADGAVDYVTLARDCTTSADEVAALLGAATP
jgi:hypothetical protein